MKSYHLVLYQRGTPVASDRFDALDDADAVKKGERRAGTLPWLLRQGGAIIADRTGEETDCSAEGFEAGSVPKAEKPPYDYDVVNGFVLAPRGVKP